jgi:hypothetical protein
MTGRTRKLTVIVAGLAALILAGAAGAIARYTVFTITPGNFARISGTNLYCANVLDTTKKRAFVCYLNGSRYPVKGTYGVVIDEFGTTIERWTTDRSGYTIVRKFANLNRPGH